MNKRGISAIVATVLIILITVAAVVIIWGLVIPMINENLGVDIVGVDLRIVTRAGYTVWDEGDGVASVQVERGADDLNISEIQLIFSFNGSTESVYESAPGINQMKTYYYRFSERPSGVEVAPVFIEKRKKVLGTISSEEELSSSGAIDPSSLVIREGTGGYEDLACKTWNSSKRDYDYFDAGELSEEGDTYCDGVGDYGECGIASNCALASSDCKEVSCVDRVCVYPSKAVDTVCSVGVCDGVGNCGECNAVGDCLDRTCRTTSCVDHDCSYELIAPCTMLFDDFSTDKGWSYGDEWERGLTSVSSCYLGEDPSNDNSGDGFVAGVVLGGCAEEVVHNYSYLTSPRIDASGVSSLSFEFYRWLKSDYPDYMTNIIEVYDGSDWQTLWVQPDDGAEIDDSSWNFSSYDISSYSNSQLQVRFGFVIGSSGVYEVSSWNVDDVKVTVLS